MTPGGGTATQDTRGGGRNYISSGTCSGVAYTQEQRLTIGYELTTRSDPTGAWVPASQSVSGLLLTIYASTFGNRAEFSTSGNVSGCTNAANLRQLHHFDLSSTTATGGSLGTAGMVLTTSAGLSRKWAAAGDADYMNSMQYVNVWFPTKGLPSGWNNGSTMSQHVIKEVIYAVVKGGLEYSTDGTAGGKSNTGAMTNFDESLIYL